MLTAVSMLLPFLSRPARAEWGPPAEGGTFWMPPQSSTVAADVDFVYYFIYWNSVAFFVVLMGAMIWFAIRYKQRQEGEKTPDIKGNHTIELVWSVFPSFLLLAMFLFGFQTYMQQSIPPADAMEVRVTGQKWRWSYSYPDLGITDVPVLVVPQGKAVRLTMSSNDVLHSFFVPDFRIKKDVLPNRYTVVWFQVDDIIGARPNEGKGPLESQVLDPKILGVTRAPNPDGVPGMSTGLLAGEHQVFCTEYCGTDHSRMYSRVAVLPQDKFDAWVEGMKVGPVCETPADCGKILFEKQGCAACHSTTGNRLVGPTVKGLYGRDEKMIDGTVVKVDDNYIRESIEVPGAKIVDTFGPTSAMPPFAGKFSDEQFVQLIEYIKTLQ